MRPMSTRGATSAEALDPRLVPYAKELAMAGIERPRVLRAVPIIEEKGDLLVEGWKGGRRARCVIEAGAPLSALVWYFPDELGQWPWEVNEQRLAGALGPLPMRPNVSAWDGARRPLA